MSSYSKKGFTTIMAKGPAGDVKHFPVRKDSKLARVAAHRNKQMERQRKQHIRDYKVKLREAKKKVPLADRAKIRLEDL